jgi:hypothetical protein
MYEIKKVKSEYPDKRNISLRLTTMIKRFNYNNSIVNDIMKKRISKAAKNLENKKLVLITFKSNDLYNPGEEYTGEAYNLNLEKIDLIDKLILKPNYLLNRLIGISFNIGITFIILLLIYTICLAIAYSVIL